MPVILAPLMLLLPSVALSSCAARDRAVAATPARVAEWDSLWPEARQALAVTLDGAEQRAPLRCVAVTGEGTAQLRVVYRGEGRTARLEAIETSAFREVGGAREWSRRFTVDGLAPGFEVDVRVPLFDGAGRELALLVNGAPYHVEPGFLEARIPLARDEATEIVVRVANHD